MRKLLLVALSFVLILGFTSQKKEMREVSPEEKQELVQCLKDNWKNPEDYIIEKFKDYDIVFIGESHRVKHNLELIHNLIPRLYKAGIYNLGIEFGGYEYQDEVDKLITADEYDEDLARLIMFKFYVIWGNKEYMDIYRKAWELNKSLPEDAPKFRVVNLGYRIKRSPKIGLFLKILLKGEPDVFMGKMILKEFVDKNQKALIFSGSHHAFTRYYQPRYNFEKKKLIRLNKNRMGNVVYRKIPNRVFNILLHQPWRTKESFEEYNYPVDGVIDTVMQEFEDKRVGFDVRGTPFGKLKDDDTYYALGHPDFALGSMCDGYIFMSHFKDFEGCTVDTKFITEKNFEEALDYFDEPERRKEFKTPENFINLIKERANIKKRFKEQGLE
jgi:hypothetical protein